MDLIGRLGAQAALAVLLVAAAVLSDAAPVVAAAWLVVGLVVTALVPDDGWPVLAGTLAAGAAVVGLCSGSSDNVGWFAVCVLTGWSALRGGAGPAVVFTALAVGLFLVQALVLEPEQGWFAWIGGTAFTAVVCLMARRQGELLEQLRAAQAGLADRVRSEERTRVARELHDVIGHSLTVSLLHVSSARLALADDPQEAEGALAQAEDLCRQSLIEVRHAVGFLREGPAGTRPLPGAGQLPALVDGFRRAGAEVRYDVVGDPTALPATTGLTVYRILQESLTNAVRHGAGGATEVRLQVDARSTVLTVDSGGASGSGRDDGAGLVGMRERAEALGGRLSAGPAGDGWRVHAVLPS